MAPAKRGSFAPGDNDVPQMLRERIESWQDDMPSSQFQQYGPYNGFFCAKFDGRKYLIKPQTLFRTPVEENDGTLLKKYGVNRDGPLPENSDNAQVVDDLRWMYDQGDISMDSTHGWVDKTVITGKKNYPDFAICEFVANPLSDDIDNKDRVVLILEIASVPPRTGSKEARATALKKIKKDVLKQLERYMAMLGKDGDRWSGNVVGIAAVGIEVAFIQPNRNPSLREWKVYTEKKRKRKNKWFSLYGPTFQQFIRDAMEY